MSETHNTKSITDYLDRIRAVFSVPVHITLIIRSDEMPDGQDIILTDDDLDMVVGAIMRRGDEGLH